ncbi:hypothetical protein ABZ410_15855 [Streptomyces cinnamoneus]|uniref:hypothetical protein n=1 Tax=Streptomyces cinnamoneus TaxID=53446 RepID=UPI00340B4A09
MNLHRFRWAPDVCVLSQILTDSDGIKVRTWSTSRLPARLYVCVIRQTREAYYGPVGKRPPGLWKRVLHALVLSNGLSYLHYCPDLPPLVLGIELSVPRFTLLLGCETRRHNQALTEHFAQRCPACVAAGWGPPENAT